MSVRRPFTRAGQPRPARRPSHLRLVHPRPREPLSVGALWVGLWLSPRQGVARVLQHRPDLTPLALLVAAGGVLHFLAAAFLRGTDPGGIAAAAGTSVAVALGLWLGAALLLEGAATLLGGTGSGLHALRVTGVAMLTWPLTGLHPWAPLALLPWLAVLGYQTIRQVHGLRPTAAAASAALPVLAGLLLFASANGLLLRLPVQLPPEWRPASTSTVRPTVKSTEPDTGQR